MQICSRCFLYSLRLKNETNEQKGGFLSRLLGTLQAGLLGNLLPGKEIVRVGYGNVLTQFVLSWL